MPIRFYTSLSLYILYIYILIEELRTMLIANTTSSLVAQARAQRIPHVKIQHEERW